MKHAFTVVFDKTEEGYVVTVPILPGLVTEGRTLEEARVMAADAIRCHVESLRKDGEPFAPRGPEREGRHLPDQVDAFPGPRGSRSGSEFRRTDIHAVEYQRGRANREARTASHGIPGLRLLMGRAATRFLVHQPKPLPAGGS